MLSHSQYDPYNTDHMHRTQVALVCRMIAQAPGISPGEKGLGSAQLYRFEPHQTEQTGWKQGTFVDITPVLAKKRAAIQCRQGQEHLWGVGPRVARQRANLSTRKSGRQSGGHDCKYAERFDPIFPHRVEDL
jgi:4-oxalomesaconate hydratase